MLDDPESTQDELKSLVIRIREHGLKAESCNNCSLLLIFRLIPSRKSPFRTWFAPIPVRIQPFAYPFDRDDLLLIVWRSLQIAYALVGWRGKLWPPYLHPSQETGDTAVVKARLTSFIRQSDIH